MLAASWTVTLTATSPGTNTQARTAQAPGQESSWEHSGLFSWKVPGKGSRGRCGRWEWEIPGGDGSGEGAAYLQRNVGTASGAQRAPRR